jgi:hypothetical protein
MQDLSLVHLITKEEDAEMREDAQRLCTQLGTPNRELAVSIALEMAYLKGKHAGEQGIISDMKRLWEKSNPKKEVNP